MPSEFFSPKNFSLAILYLPDVSSSVVVTRGVSLLAVRWGLVGVAIETDQSAEVSETRVGTIGEDTCIVQHYIIKGVTIGH